MRFLSLRAQNELDAACASVQNGGSMIFNDRFHKSGSRFATILGIASAFCLSSCWEKEADVVVQAEQPAAAPAPAATPAPAADADKLAETRDALFQFAVYTLGQKVSSPDMFPELNTMVKDMLEMQRNYYAELKKGEPSLERARLALQIASTTRDLGAITKAQSEYENALQEIEALPAEIKGQTDVKRMMSSCYNGLGVCLLTQNKTADALLKYESALAIDAAQYELVAPADGTELPEGEVEPKLARAATDLVDSYRCYGDCQRAADDPEEALTTYMKGHELIQRLKRLSPEMSIAYVKLLTAMGNLQNSMGKPQEAMGAWVMAAKICQSLNASSPKLDVKAETKRCFDALLPTIQSVGQKLQAEQDDAKKKAEEEKAAAEKAAQEAAAAEKAAAERLAAEQKAAEEKAAAEKAAQEAANNRVRNRRRR